eukprot:4662-Heterococcus_DN1.PRE.1
MAPVVALSIRHVTSAFSSNADVTAVMWQKRDVQVVSIALDLLRRRSVAERLTLHCNYASTLLPILTVAGGNDIKGALIIGVAIDGNMHLTVSTNELSKLHQYASFTMQQCFIDLFTPLSSAVLSQEEQMNRVINNQNSP